MSRDVQRSGEREYEALIGAPPGEGLAEVRRSAPQLYEALVGGAFGVSLARPELSRAAREIATVAMLAARGGAERQLATHTRAALRAGITSPELLALCEHVAVYAGFPSALNALAVIAGVLREAGAPPPASLRRVGLADHETLVAQQGESGPAVVLIHALGLNWRMWEPVMTRLSRGRRVFAYDLRSHGWAAGSPTPFEMENAARDLLAVLDGLGLARAHVVGLSFGGGIAQTAVVSNPERFESLALLATTYYPFDTFESRARSAETDGMEAQIVPSLTRWFTPAALAGNTWGVRYARELVRRSDPVDWAASWRAFTSFDVQDRLGELALPTLVLAGELDASTTPEIMRGIADRIPGASYRELPATPHMQTLEQPELVAEALNSFLTAEPPSKGER